MIPPRKPAAFERPHPFPFLVTTMRLGRGGTDPIHSRQAGSGKQIANRETMVDAKLWNLPEYLKFSCYSIYIYIYLYICTFFSKCPILKSASSILMKPSSSDLQAGRSGPSHGDAVLDAPAAGHRFIPTFSHS